jgi:glycosyltransferase involved in cell wall biosynthesis
MRISVVSSSVASERLGGSEVYATELAAALSERHEVLLHTGARTGPAGVQTVTLPSLPDLAREASGPRKAAWHLRDQWRLSVHRALERQLRSFRPDVVHTHHPQGLSAGVFTAVSACEVPHAHTVHDPNVLCSRITMIVDGRFCGGRCLSCRPQRLIRSRFLRRSLDRLIAPSDYFRDMHVRAGVVRPERARTIRQGAEPGTARLRKPGPEGPTVGYLGALATHKGVRALLEAFRSAPSGWRLRIAGGGPLEDAVRREASSNSRIELAGLVLDEEKNDFLNSLDVLVIPSEYEENAPLVAVEAAVRGLPAVVSDRGGLPETAEASVFRAGEPAGLLGALRRLVAEPAELAGRSRRLLESRESFLWGNHVRRVEGALREIVR